MKGMLMSEGYEIGGEITLADGTVGKILSVGEGTAAVEVISPSGAVSTIYIRIGKAAAAKATKKAKAKKEPTKIAKKVTKKTGKKS